MVIFVVTAQKKLQRPQLKVDETLNTRVFN